MPRPHRQIRALMLVAVATAVTLSVSRAIAGTSSGWVEGDIYFGTLAGLVDLMVIAATAIGWARLNSNRP